MKAKKALFVIAIVVISAIWSGVVAAAPARLQNPSPSPVTEILAVLFPTDFVKAVAGLLAVIVLDLILGVSVAIQAKAFQWSRLADFYRSKVIPNLLGWTAADILLRIGAYYQLPIVEQLQPLGTIGLYALTIAALLGQIGTKLAALRGEQPPANPPA